jgi:hypothetical protein
VVHRRISCEFLFPRIVNKIKMHHTFFRMECECGLFHERLSNGTYFWDVVRRDVFIALVEYKKKGKINVLKSPPCYITHIKNTAKVIINKITFRYLACKQPQYIFTTFQRKVRGNRLVDEISEHLVDLLGEKATCIEYSNKNKISALSIVTMREKTRLPPVYITTGHVVNDALHVDEILHPLINKYFGISVDLKDRIDYQLRVYTQQLVYFRKLFSCYKPEALICNNDNSLKALFKAAKECSIKTIELQHGASPMSIMWTYPSEVKHDDAGVIMPDYFLLYSDFWREIYNYPVENVLSIGNDNFYIDKIIGSMGILFVANINSHKKLLNIAINVSKWYGAQVYYKLHPEQYSDFERIKLSIHTSTNIELLRDEYPLSKLFSLCDYVVGVRSSLFYSALQAGKAVFLLKYSNYDWDAWMMKKAFVFDDADSLIGLIQKHKPAMRAVEEVYFSKFDPNLFMSVLDANYSANEN